jgi:hypothetical protein
MRFPLRQRRKCGSNSEELLPFSFLCRGTACRALGLAASFAIAALLRRLNAKPLQWSVTQPFA